MIYLNKETIKDKIYACWIGKNIGGTMGAPYEGQRDMQNISGFVTEKGMSLPNDDLDLQLVWLHAMEQEGPYKMSSNILGEYWISYIPPHWNEYGIGKANLKIGLLPPLSGEIDNDKWKHSNGAWIRSEIWACLTPGFVDIVKKYAYMDACVDHGYGEGTYAEIFTASLECAAFTNRNIKEIIDYALKQIPEDCRVAKAVKLVIDSYDRGVDWKITRNLLVEQSADIGWFQAPANVGFVILGLLYGEGDFKKSMIYAINCGDDTDCTGATVGAFLGLLYGTQGIPSDWSAHIGDNIQTIAVDGSNLQLAKTCTELTDRILKMMPTVFKANGVDMEFTEGEHDLSTPYRNGWVKNYWKFPLSEYLSQSPYSYDGGNFVHMNARVVFEKRPSVKPGESIQAKIILYNLLADPRRLFFKVHLPEGWSTDNYQRNLLMKREMHIAHEWDVTITAGENVEPVNRVIVEVTGCSRAVPALIPITILG